MTIAQTRPEDVRFADAVVIGRVQNYRIVKDWDFRRRMLKQPGLTPELRAIYRSGKPLLSDYATFTVAVDANLKGQVQRSFTVTWRNSTFGLPEILKPGPYLIALRKTGGASPPLRGPSATVYADPPNASHTLLQAPCAGAFLFDVGSPEAKQVRRILGK